MLCTALRFYVIIEYYYYYFNRNGSSSTNYVFYDTANAVTGINVKRPASQSVALYSRSGPKIRDNPPTAIYHMYIYIYTYNM